jgi:hypothetical protein
MEKYSKSMILDSWLLNANDAAANRIPRELYKDTQNGESRDNWNHATNRILWLRAINSLSAAKDVTVWWLRGLRFVY